MKLNERFPITDSFPTYSGIASYLFYNNLASVDIDAYLKTYLNSKKQQFDYSSLMLFGERECNMIMNMTPDENHVLQTQLMNLTFAHYKEKWTSLFNMLSSESDSDYHDYNPIENYNMVETETGEGNVTHSGADRHTSTGSATDTDTREIETTVTPTGKQTQVTYNVSDAETRNFADGVTYGHTETVTHGKSVSISEEEKSKTNNSESSSGSSTNQNNVFGFNTVGADGVPADKNTGSASSSKTETFDNVKTGTNTESGTTATGFTGTDTQSHTGTGSNLKTGTETTLESGYETTEEVHSGSVARQTSGSDSDIYGHKIDNENERHLTRSGNIGVTTTQQMMQQEIAIRQEYEFFNIVLKDIIDLFTYPVY